MPPQTRAAQLSSLQQEFPSTTTVKETPSELLLKVDHNIRISATTEYGLSLFIKLLPSFPKTPPVATMPYTGKTVPITPPNINPTETAAYQWDGEGSSLVVAVRNAFQNAADRWGPVAPPTMESVTLQLSGQTDRLLRDLVTNPNCLDAYCYQLPIVKQMREVSRHTVNEVERVANENVKLRPAVEDLQATVRRLQAQLQQQLEALQRVGSTPLLTSICTPEALVKTLEADVQTLNKERHTIGKSALATYKTDKRSFQEQLEQYKAKSIQMHILDMKARTFPAKEEVDTTTSEPYDTRVSVNMSQRNSSGHHVTMNVPEDDDYDSPPSYAVQAPPPLTEGDVECMKCHAQAATFETDPCHHLCFCRACAMKCASGGRCKVCNEMYGGLRHKN